MPKAKTVILVRLGSNPSEDKQLFFKSSINASRYVKRDKSFMNKAISDKRYIFKSKDSIYWILDYGEKHFNIPKDLDRANLSKVVKTVERDTKSRNQSNKPAPDKVKPARPKVDPKNVRLNLLLDLEQEYGSIAQVPDSDSRLQKLRLLYQMTASEAADFAGRHKVTPKTEKLFLNKKIRKLIEFGYSTAETASLLRVSNQTVLNSMAKQGLKPKKAYYYKIRGVNKDNPRYYKPLYASTIHEIAKFFETSQSKLYPKLEKLGYKIEMIFKLWGDLAVGDDFLDGNEKHTKGANAD